MADGRSAGLLHVDMNYSSQRRNHLLGGALSGAGAENSPPTQPQFPARPRTHAKRRSPSKTERNYRAPSTTSATTATTAANTSRTIIAALTAVYTRPSPPTAPMRQRRRRPALDRVHRRSPEQPAAVALLLGVPHPRAPPARHLARLAPAHDCPPRERPRAAFPVGEQLARLGELVGRGRPRRAQRLDHPGQPATRLEPGRSGRGERSRAGARRHHAPAYRPA